MVLQGIKQRSRMEKYSFLLILLILFLFFLPFRSIEIPGILIGFSINFSRLFIVLATLFLFLDICIDHSCFNRIFNTYSTNPYVMLLLIYFLFSTLYYYFSLSLDKTVMFGSGDFFFRSWRGRPIGQFLAFLTYGVIPYYLIKYYAEDNPRRKVIEKTIIVSIILLLYYGYLQQVSYYLGLPVSGRILGEGRVPAYSYQGISILRFYSLAGEPRDFGGFIIGAIFFYWYYCYGRITLFTKINIFLMFIAFLLTAAASAHIIFLISAIGIIADMIFLNRSVIRMVFVKYILGFLFLIIILFVFSNIGPTLMSRTIGYYEEFAHSFWDKPDNVAAILTSQSVDLVIIPYLANIDNVGFLNILFGAGYGNFLTPVSDMLRNDFNFDIVSDPKFTDTRSFIIKLFVECGIIGSGIFLLMLFYTLKLNKKLIRLYKNTNRDEYYKTLILRYTFIVFCVSGAIQTSFYYFIIMGIIISKYNMVFSPANMDAGDLEKDKEITNENCHY